MISVAANFCSHIETASQAVPAAMSQVARRHMRTRVKESVARPLHIQYGFFKPCLNERGVLDAEHVSGLP